MAQVQLLPIGIYEEGALRLADGLSVLIENGSDFGRREAQIQSIGQSLARCVQRLCAELTRLGVAKRLTEPLSTLERTAASARTYQADASS